MLHHMDYMNLPFILNEVSEELKSVIILSFDMKHFEVIGKLLENNRIQREFTLNDSILHQMLPAK